MAAPKTEQFDPKEKIQYQEAHDNNKSTLQSGDDVRSSIAQFLNDSEFRQTLDAEALKNYEDIVNKKGHIKPDDKDNLSRFYNFMAKEWEKIQATKRHMKETIANAVSRKVISEKDGKFYDEKLAQNVFNGKQNITEEILRRTEKELEDNLKNREKERDEYFKILQSPLVKNSYLAIDKDTKIKVPDQKGFLEMSVPDRRKLLKQLKDEWKKAEKYAEQEGSAESAKLTKEYSDLLQKAKRDGILGNKTIEKYMEGFKKIDIKEKKHWLQELKNGNQLERYKKLWQDARKSLKGPALAYMEGLRDKMGYTELFIELGRTREREATRLDNDYKDKLDHAHAQKIISKHTLGSFMNDSEEGMKSQNLSGKYRYMEEFDKQMGKYKDLRAKIDQLTDKSAQKALNKMYEDDESGFTEINKKYCELTGQAPDSANSTNTAGEKTDLLNTITNTTVKTGIKEVNELLKKQGAEKQKAFLVRLERMIVGKESNQFNEESFQKRLQGMSQAVQARTTAKDIAVKNASIKKADNIASFQDALRQRRGIKQEALEADSEPREEKKRPGIFSFQRLFTKRRAVAEKQSAGITNPEQNISVSNITRLNSRVSPQKGEKTKEAEAMDMKAVEENMQAIQLHGSARVFQDEGFREVETAEHNGEKRRLALVEINRVKGLEHWDTTNQKNEYRGEREGGKDNVSFAIQATDGRRIELKLEEIRAMKQYIEKDIASGLSGAEDVEKNSKMAA